MHPSVPHGPARAGPRTSCFWSARWLAVTDRDRRLAPELEQIRPGGPASYPPWSALIHEVKSERAHPIRTFDAGLARPPRVWSKRRKTLSSSSIRHGHLFADSSLGDYDDQASAS
jgi:hypothetical protein